MSKIRDRSRQAGMFPITPYAGTGGSVAQVSSSERADREMSDGTLSKRQQTILHTLGHAGRDGAIWKQLGDILQLHHGQISGALSNLHAARQVFMVKEMRHGCHPYVHIIYRDQYMDEETIDTPTSTLAGERRDKLERLVALCRQAGIDRYNVYTCQAIDALISEIDE